MGICLYSNGIVEDFIPESLVFSEKELISSFNEFSHIRTKRLIEVLNCWCIWGENKNYDAIEFNRIGSDITQEPIYSHVLFVHDSEINPSWNSTDNILYRNYFDFLKDIKKLIDDIASNIIDEYRNNEDQDHIRVMPVLETLGPTRDKRVLFSFNPYKQFNEFYENDQFLSFSKKTYDYIHSHIQDEEPFTIFADKTAIIIVDTSNVSFFIDKMLNKFTNEEQYEICKELTIIKTRWNKALKTKKKSKKPSADI